MWGRPVGAPELIGPPGAGPGTGTPPPRRRPSAAGDGPPPAATSPAPRGPGPAVSSTTTVAADSSAVTTRVSPRCPRTDPSSATDESPSGVAPTPSALGAARPGDQGLGGV